MPSFQAYGIPGHLIWILNSINSKHFQRFATQIVLKLGLSDSSEQRKSMPTLFHNQNFNFRALKLTSWVLDRNLNKSEANLFLILKIFLEKKKKMLHSWKHQINRGNSVIGVLAERLFARLFHRISLSIHNRNYYLFFTCCIQSFFALNSTRFHGIRLRTKSGKAQIRVVNKFPRSRH